MKIVKDRKLLIFFALLIVFSGSLFSNSKQMSEVSYKIQYMIGNRQAKELIQFLGLLDFEKLSLIEKADYIIALSELYSWAGVDYSYSEKAYKLADDMLKKYPEFWKFHYAMAVVLSHRVQKNNLLALTLVNKIDYHLEQAMKFGPNEWEPFFLAGVRNLEVPLFPNLSLAEQYLKKALNNNPEHIFTYLMYGKLLEKKGQFCDALNVYKTALQLSIRPEWKVVDEEAKNEIKTRISEVERKCTKK
ncbi:MAG: tetratricopeptide repeat protein [Fervidobacterium pennivorans]